MTALFVCTYVGTQKITKWLAKKFTVENCVRNSLAISLLGKTEKNIRDSWNEDMYAFLHTSWACVVITHYEKQENVLIIFSCIEKGVFNCVKVLVY